MASPGRPLPVPPADAYYRPGSFSPTSDVSGARPDPYISAYPYPAFAPRSPASYDDQPTTLRGGTILHKGFYDLLALIPSTPSPSRFFWPSRLTPSQGQEPIAGPRYDEIPSANLPPSTSPYPVSPQTSPSGPKRGRKISKDMVSKPTGFVYVSLSYHFFK